MKYNAMDAMKLIMAMAVVAIHVGPLDGCSNEFAVSLYGAFVACAVPFFFLSSGFLLAGKMSPSCSDENDLGRIRKYIRHMVYLYILWTVIYLPLAIWRYVECGDAPLDAVEMYIRGLFFMGEHYNSWMLWYILSSIYSMAIIYFLLKRKVSMETVLAVSVAVFLLGAILDWASCYTGSDPVVNGIDTFLGYTFNNGRLFRGMFYLALGMYMSQHMPGLISGIAMALIGYLADCMGADGILSTIVCSVGLLCIAAQLRLPDSRAYPVMRTMSTGVYFIHLWVWTVCYMIMYGEKTGGPTCYLIVLSISLIISFAYAVAKPYLHRKQPSASS